MDRILVILPHLLLLALLVGCGGPGAATASFAPSVPAAAALRSNKIQHVVIIFQENRTPDNLFRGLQGADTVAPVPLQPIGLTAGYDLSHAHRAFLLEYAGGKMNGFQTASLGYVPRSEVQPYFDMAAQYTFGDRMFQTNEGPSFPAHQYIVSGTSTIAPNSHLRASENPTGRSIAGPFNKGGCDSPSTTLVPVIDQNGGEARSVYPCFERPSLTDLLDAKGLSWRYYQAHLGAGIWNGLDAIKHVQQSAEYSSSVIAPSAQVLTDIAAGSLANVTWVTPTAEASDHARSTDGSGPSWVAAVVNAVGKSRYWNSTAIIVTWDDWGGWYDHVKPEQYNPYELGFRVPLLVISPYAKRGYVSHKPYEFGSVLKFVERTFDLGSLGSTDVRSDGLSGCFDFTQAARAFKVIHAPLPASHFIGQPDSGSVPDDDL